MTLGIPGAVSAASDDVVRGQRRRRRHRELSIYETFHRLQKRREVEHWSLDRWYEALEENGIPYGNTIVDTNNVVDTGDVSTQALSLFEPSDLTLTVNYYNIGRVYEPPYYDAIEMAWEFDKALDDSNTGKPKDIASIGINPDHYTKPSSLDGEEWFHLGDATELAGPDSAGSGGIAAKYNGYYFKPQIPLIGDGEAGGDPSLSSSITLYVDPNYSVDERRIYFSYSMLYDNATYGGSSIGSDGVISVSIANEQDSWTVAPAYEEDDIRGGREYSR